MKILNIIFSMNRALQCDSLLTSLEDHATGIDTTAVICRTTSRLHIDAYDKAAELHPNADFCAETEGFGCTQWLKRVLGTYKDITHVCINVDDQIYFRPADFQRAATTVAHPVFIWSWRLGHTPPWTYGLKTHWAARDSADKHYGYLWHSDGALYELEAYLRMLNGSTPNWRTDSNLIPNDLEQNAAMYCPIWGQRLIHCGPLEQTCITWQINKESTTESNYKAPWATVPETELNALAAAFLAGKRVDNQKLYNDLSWTTRFQKPTSAPTHIEACPEAAAFYATLLR